VRLDVTGLRAGYGGQDVLRGLDLQIAAGEFVAIVGPNGSGKSTLLRAMGRVLRPRGGAVLLDGRAITQWPNGEVARNLALLPQGPALSNDLAVEELVWIGRSPHQGMLGLPSQRDRTAVERALHDTGIEAFRSRRMASLSGGERQRAWIAMALAQEPRILLLDEPTTFLDLSYQIEVLELLRRLNRERGLTVVLILHDLNHAARYAGRVIVLNEGRVFCDGTPAAVLTVETLRAVFGVEGRVIPASAETPMVIVPLARATIPAADKPEARASVSPAAIGEDGGGLSALAPPSPKREPADWPVS
jgi:iron complex transport system ATP-binding protein